MKKRKMISKDTSERKKDVTDGTPLMTTGDGSAEVVHSMPDIMSRLRGIAKEWGLWEERDAAAIGVKILKGVSFGLVSLLFGRTPLLLDTYTLGIAFLCASEKNLIYIFIGLLISAFTVNTGDQTGILFSPYVYLSVYVMIIIIRIAARMFIDQPYEFSPSEIFSKGKKRNEHIRLLILSRFRENTYLRMATACAAAFFVSLYAMNKGAYRLYDLFSAMFAMVSAPAITFVFSGLCAEGEDGSPKVMKEVSNLGLIFAVIFSLRDIFILGISACFCVGFFATLYLARRRGVLVGTLSSLVISLAAAPIYAPAFVLAAIAAGICKTAFAAASASSVVALLWGVYIDGLGAITYFMPAVICASVLICAFEGFSLVPSGIREKERVIDEKITTDLRGSENERERIARLSDTFGQISRVLYDISDRMRVPGASEIRTLCLNSFDTYCLKCENFDNCRTKDYSEFSETMSKFGEILSRDGRVSSDKLPRYITDRCINISDIILEVNTEYAEILREHITGEKTELFALDYDAVSHILADAVEMAKKENVPDIELQEKFRRFGLRDDIEMKEFWVWGDRRKKIYAGDIGKKAEEMGVGELKEKLESVCGLPLKDPIFELKDGKVSLRTEVDRRFSVESGMAQKGNANESVCGDTATAFETSNDSFYALISDGMGSGTAAALTSELCGLFLTKMLQGGNRKETSLKMLNTLLRSKSGECSATVDLMELDLINGEASFIKSGAAPSFVRRGDKLYKLRSNTVPIGIMNAIDAEQVRFDISDGDVIIMLSDGISQCPEECLWLMEMLGGEWNEDESLDSFAARIAETADENGSGDDISVLLVRVNENKKVS
ncbi:MAG: SpoIIE family protein phosphatase [Clostridia bacterium]|nr:SpoIIE family protein phosphatase [Clostridia bacterium]